MWRKGRRNNEVKTARSLCLSRSSLSDFFVLWADLGLASSLLCVIVSERPVALLPLLLRAQGEVEKACSHIVVWKRWVPIREVVLTF